jgi:hypothetical protein
MHRLISLPSTDVCLKWGGGVKSKLVVANDQARGNTGPQWSRCSSDVESWYGFTVLLLTFRYVHELSIRRLLFVHVYTRLLQKGDTKL